MTQSPALFLFVGAAFRDPHCVQISETRWGWGDSLL